MARKSNVVKLKQGRMPVPTAAAKLQRYDPDRGLEKITIAEASAKLFARAKDLDQLRKAIEAKLIEQARYIVWRDGVVKAGQPRKELSTRRDNSLPALEARRGAGACRAATDGRAWTREGWRENDVSERDIVSRRHRLDRPRQEPRRV